MRWSSRLAAVLLIASAALLVSIPAPAADPAEAKGPPRVLPGLQGDGFIQLPNQWKLSPAGKHLDVGDLPLNIQIHPPGNMLRCCTAASRITKFTSSISIPAGGRTSAG